MILYSKAITDSEGFLFINKDDSLKKINDQKIDEKIWKIKNYKFICTPKDEEDEQILKLLNFILKTIKKAKYRKLFPLRLILIEKTDEFKNDSQEIKNDSQEIKNDSQGLKNKTNDTKSSIFSSILSIISLFVKSYIVLLIFALIFIFLAANFGLVNLKFSIN
jgi:hypothetical protein